MAKQPNGNGNRQLATVPEKVGNLRQLIIGAMPEIAEALPKHLTPERMLRLAMTAVKTTPDLLRCTPMSVVGAIVQASQLGLEPNVLGQCYLVPYRVKGTLTCQLIIGYRGMIDLSRRTKQLVTIYAQEVYPGDDYDFGLGTEQFIRHKPSPQPAKENELVAAYAVARLKGGELQMDWMWRRDIEKRRAVSKAESGPWVTWFAEMSKKTVLRRLWKFLPASVEMQRAEELEQAIDTGQPQDFSGLLGDIAPPPPAALDDLVPGREPGEDEPEEAVQGELVK